METSVLGISNLIQGFRLSCQTECKSPRTVDWYTSFLNRFRSFLEQDSHPTSVNYLERSHIRGFIRYLQIEAKVPHTGASLSPTTVQSYVRVLKVFFSWATKEDYLSSNPMNAIQLPKSPAKVITTFTDEQTAKLTAACVDSAVNGHRDLTILLLFLDSGLRVSELVGIELADVRLTEGHIIIRHAKGQKERIVPVGSIVQKSLWKYINVYRPRPLTASLDLSIVNERLMTIVRIVLT